MLSLFVNILLPVFLVAALGALLDHWMRFDPAPLTWLSLYLFSPALVFSSIVHSTLALTDVAAIVGFVFALTFALVVVGYAVTRVSRLDGTARNAFLLSVVLINAGNFGLPVMLLALGQPGLERGVIFFVATNVVANSIGVFLARQGLGPSREAFTNIFRIPPIYAIVLGLAVRLSGISLPDALLKPIELLGNAAIPMLLVILGIRLRRVRLSASVRWIGLASGLRLLVAPALAIVLASLFRMEGLTRQVVILQSSMPTAVFATVLAIRFDVDSDIVAGTIAVSTLVSALTLTGWMWVLGVRPG